MRERPILMSTENVKAILEGRKTQTRRVIKPQPIWKKQEPNSLSSSGWYWHTSVKDATLNSWPRQTEFANALKEFCPYGQVGDRVWLREKALYWDGGAAGISAVVYQDDPEIPDLVKDNNALFVARTTMNIAAGENVVGKWVWKPSIHMYREDSRITLEITEIRVERQLDITLEDAIKEGFGSERAFNEAFLKLNPHLKDENPWVWVINFKRL